MSKAQAVVAAHAVDNDEPHIGQMKGGDYLIHVYIQSGKNFKLTGSATCNPKIEVKTCGQTKYSTSREEVPCNSQTTVQWREHLFVEPKNISKQEICVATVQISVKNKGLLRDELIGYYEFDLQSIYFREKHTLQHQWVALNNPESINFTELSGLLKVSISVLAEGDQQILLEDQEGGDTDSADVIIPATIKKEFKQLKVRFLQAEKLPKLDTFGTIDAYFLLEFGGKKWKTKAVTQQNDLCVFDQEFWVPLTWPLSLDRMIIRIFDEDKIHDEIVGSLYFSLKELVLRGSGGGFYCWYNIYGSPLGVSGQGTDQMNANPELASTWKGRVLLHISCEDCLQPEKRIQDFLDTENIRRQAGEQGYLTDHQYQIIAEIGAGIQLPKEKNYQVKIKIGDFEMMTSNPQLQKGTYNQWYERIAPQNGIFLSKFKNLEMIRNVFIYLMDDGKPLSFWHGQIQDFEEGDAQIKWLVLRSDKALGLVSDEANAGMISIKLSVNDVAAKGNVDFKSFESWSKKPPKRPKVLNIRVFLFQCRDIPSSDDDGNSDCYIKIWNSDNKEMRTRTVHDTLNPIFYEVFDVAHEFTVLKDAPPIILNLWDENGTLEHDKYLGRCLLYLNQAASNKLDGTDDYDFSEDAVNKIPKPKWHDIRHGFDASSPSLGQVLCSIIVNDDTKFKQPVASKVRLTKSVPTRDYNCEINILGLRQLESFGLMPIRKPFIKLNIKSMLPASKAEAVTNILTEPCPGANPNFNTIVTFSQKLPVEDVYCPALTCDVFDYIMLGLKQPQIGSFTINIGQIKQDCETEYSHLQRAGEIIIQKLSDYLQKPVGQMEKEAIDRYYAKLDPEMRKELEYRKLSMSTKSLAPEINFRPPTRKNTQKSDSQQQKEGYNQQFDEEDPESLLIHQQASAANRQRVQTIFQSKFEAKIKALQAEQLKSQERIDSIARMDLLTKQQTRPRSKLAEALNLALARRLKESKTQLNEEIKQIQQKQRKIDQIIMMEQCGGKTDQIVLPNYQKHVLMDIYHEIDPPPSTLYKKVGYNDLAQIRKMLEPNDLIKRLAAQQQQATNNTQERDEELQVEIKKQDFEFKLGKTNQHYRKYYQTELELVPSIFKINPFLKIDIFKGKKASIQDSIFSLFKKQVDNHDKPIDKKKVGYFKGLIEIWNDEDLKSYKAGRRERLEKIYSLVQQIYQKVKGKDFPLGFLEIQNKVGHGKLWRLLQGCYLDVSELKVFFDREIAKENIKKELETQTPCKVRLFVLDGYGFSSRDIVSDSDPYLKVTLGKQSYDCRKEYQIDQPNPKFEKSFEFQTSFPGAPALLIEVYDYDDVFGDDLIGKTYIDLDDRFFNPDWQNLLYKPIEFRQLYIESSGLSQGQLSSWLEIHPNIDKSNLIDWNLESEPITNYQVRMCVFNTEGIPNMDVEGTSDVFIKSYIDHKKKFQTDTHYRCMNGNASFNYRILFDIQAPRKDTILVLQAYDRDLFTTNDYICEWTIDLKEAFDFVCLSQQTVHITDKYQESCPEKDAFRDKKFEFLKDGSNTFWVSTQSRDGQTCRIRLDLKLMTQEQASEVPVGEARNEPNLDPMLPPPIGRIVFTMNPIKMLSQLVSQELLKKLYIGILCGVCCALGIMMLPMLASNFLSTFIVWMFTGH